MKPLNRKEFLNKTNHKIPGIQHSEQAFSSPHDHQTKPSQLSMAVRQALSITPLMALSLAGMPSPALAQQAVVELSQLDGSNGFVLNGVAAGDNAGGSVSTAGDVNGDGIDDLLIGAGRADVNGDSSGSSYVVFGASGVGAGGSLELSALNSHNGFILNGVAAGDQSGHSVSTAGDVNGDGVDDLLIGAYRSVNTRAPGVSYVVFGVSGVGTGGTLELSELDGSNGFVLNGAAIHDYA